MTTDGLFGRRGFLAGSMAFGVSAKAFALTTRRTDSVAPGYDYVIVGAGSAGCVVANRLSADPAASVLLIEAGGPDTLPEIHDPRLWTSLMGSSVDWAYSTQPQAHLDGRIIPYPRGKVIGGSSAINAMGHQRGNPAIFDEWAETNPGWSYRDMLPLFIKSEDFSGGAGPYHGVGGPLGVLSSPLDERNPVATSFVETAVAMGFPANPDIDGAQTSGAFFNHLAIKDHRRQSTGVAYLHPVMGRPNLTVLTDAALIKLDIVKGRCVGITYDHAGQPRQVRATQEVILSTGAVDTPKFLMLAGIGPAEALRRHGIAVVADLAGVGQNLHDHPIIVAAAYEAKRPVPLGHFSHGESMLLTRSANAGATDKDRGAPPDRLLICTTFPASPGVESSTYAFVAAAMNPKSRGTITLASTDPRAAAVIDPNFLAEGADIDCLASGIALARQVGAGPGLADWRLREVSPAPESDPLALRAMIAATAATFNHAVGTCRMGPDSRAVVDHELRVHGVRALRVVDASVIPRIPNAMPNAAIIGIAEKAASLIGRAA